MWVAFEIMAMGLLVASLGLGIYCALADHVRYAIYNVFIALINIVVIVVARMAQAGGL